MITLILYECAVIMISDIRLDELTAFTRVTQIFQKYRRQTNDMKKI
jgi:hypothetical protein